MVRVREKLYREVILVCEIPYRMMLPRVVIPCIIPRALHIPVEGNEPWDSAWCRSGQYLAVGSGADARVYATKQDWSVVQTFVDLPKHVRSFTHVAGCRSLHFEHSRHVTDLLLCMLCDRPDFG